MSLHRCAACGSQNVVVDKQAGGVSYNYKKGIVGTAVFGIGGAVAGIESKSQEVFKCQDCGMTLTYEMSDKLRNYIDIALIDENAKNNPSAYTDIDPIICSWTFLKRNYKNIEDAQFDITRKNGLMSYATATQEEFDNAVDTLVKYKQDVYSNHKFSNRTRKMTLMKYYSLQNAVNILVENLIKFQPNLALGYGYDSDYKYRGLDRHVIEQCVNLYIFEQCKAQTGEYPVYNFSYCSDNLKEYLENDFFILDFLNHFYIIKVGFDTFFPWTAERFWENSHHAFKWILRRLFFGLERFEFEGCDGQEVYISYNMPYYTVDNGRLYCRQETLMKRHYFSKNPEKESEYNKQIEVHKKQVSEKGSIEQEIKTLEQNISHNKNIIEENSTAITKLRNKIFGKKAALAKADELEKERQELTKKTAEYSDKLVKLNNKINDILDEQEFYINLVEEMDRFLVWEPVDEAE